MAIAGCTRHVILYSLLAVCKMFIIRNKISKPRNIEYHQTGTERMAGAPVGYPLRKSIPPPLIITTSTLRFELKGSKTEILMSFRVDGAPLFYYLFSFGGIHSVRIVLRSERKGVLVLVNEKLFKPTPSF